MWTEENYNYYELSSIVNNYGPKMPWGISAQDAVAYAKDFHADFYLNEDEFQMFSDKGFDFYVNENGLEKLTVKLDEQIPIVESGMHHLVTLDLSVLSNEELFKTYLDYVIPYGNLMRSYIVTQPQFIAQIEKELRNKLSMFPNTDEVFVTLTHSDNEFVFSEKGDFFQKSFAELIGHENAEIDRNILDTSLYKENKQDISLKEEMIKKYALSDNVINLGKILAKIGEIRLKMRFIWMPTIYFFELFLIELKRRYKISKSQIRKYDSEEFDELIRIGQIVDSSVLEERSKGFAKVLSNGEIITLVGEEANKFIESISVIDRNIKEFTGSVASKGLARGKVIVLSYAKSFEHTKKIEKMTAGDILVSEMTRPNIIIACKKAGAIITDEGGITCHAAIVSRELKIPCVIGTKIATKILKDGDLVEVDANHGIVRIIK